MGLCIKTKQATKQQNQLRYEVISTWVSYTMNLLFPTRCRGSFSTDLRVRLQVHLPQQGHHGSHRVPNVLQFVLDVFDHVITAGNTTSHIHIKHYRAVMIAQPNRKCSGCPSTTRPVASPQHWPLVWLMVYSLVTGVCIGYWRDIHLFTWSASEKAAEEQLQTAVETTMRHTM